MAEAIEFVELPGGVLAPVFRCAECGELIQGRGIIQWDSYAHPNFVVLHKLTGCSAAYDYKHGGRSCWKGWRDLDEFLAQLSRNTTEPWPVTTEVSSPAA
jgi:hypothetical protein